MRTVTAACAARARDACGIGFLASRKGIAERRLVDIALDLCTRYDHRGAPGHGAGILVDIPWPLLLDRFPEHARAIAQRDVALGMFFLPFDAPLRRYCVERVEDLAGLAGADVLGWADVPLGASALSTSVAQRTTPLVRQALLRRPGGLSEEDWKACRYLLRLALDEVLGEEVGDAFKLCSLSNRTVVYKGLSELSRVAVLYPDLTHPDLASRFVLFHSRYSTNTASTWRRAQPFWALAHNGEIATIRGNVAWIDAIGRDLIESLGRRDARLQRLAKQVRTIIAPGGSDSANLDDMLIALIAGGMPLPQAVIALLPEAATMDGGGVLREFHDAMSVFLGACDGPAAVVACDGDEAVAHLDRNGLRPLWLLTTRDYAVAASELTGTLELGGIEEQRLLGPGETVLVRLRTGEILFNDELHATIARSRFPVPVVIPGGIAEPPPAPDAVRLEALQVAFGMTREDIDVVLAPLIRDGKPAVGAMGDDTPPAALLDRLPRRLEDHFKLIFAQETSPPIDPIRDAWVFEAGVDLGDRAGLWAPPRAPCFRFPHRVLARCELAWLLHQPRVVRVPLLYEAEGGPAEIEPALGRAIARAVSLAGQAAVLVLSDEDVTAGRAPLPMLRAVARLHDALVREGQRHRVGVVACAGVWDIHHVALLVALGADAVCPWLGCLLAGEREDVYLKGVRSGFIEAMSMIGVTPAAAYCGAKLVEAIGLDREFCAEEFPGVTTHLGGIGRATLDAEWFAFHRTAYAAAAAPALIDAGEFRQRRGGRPHANDGELVRALHAVAGFARDAAVRVRPAGSFAEYERVIGERPPIGLLDLVRPKVGEPVPLAEVEPEEHVLWRFMASGMSDGALSEPAHRAVARAMNVLRRYCLTKFRRAGVPEPAGIGPIANSGEGGFDKARTGRPDGNRSIQYAGGRFTITPFTAASADEAEVKFAQGAKPGKGGQLPGRKVAERVARQRGCLPGFELISPPVNHNLYSIEDVKLMLESWRHLNPRVRCALKFVATAGVEMVALGGVNAGADRIHISDGCGGTGAAKRVDQKHAGIPAAAVLPRVHDLLVEEGVRDLVEISVDGGVQSAEQVLKLVLLGADRIGFGTSLLIALGCSMLRQCHLAGPHPDDPTGRRRIGCSVGVATQDPALVSRFAGSPRNILLFLQGLAGGVRARMAELGIRRLGDVVGRRDLLERRADLTGKARQIDTSHLVSAPPARATARRPGEQARRHAPQSRTQEIEAARQALEGAHVMLRARLTNADRCVGVGAAGEIARRCGDLGLDQGRLALRHEGVAGHFYAAYAVAGLDFVMRGTVADSSFTAAYGGRLVIVPPHGNETLTLAGNTFAYGARGGRAFIAGRAGNRFGVCLRRNQEGGGVQIVVQGVGANAFQYMTGGTVLVLGPVGHNLGAGLTGGTVYLFDPAPERLDRRYIQCLPLDEADADRVRALLNEHAREAGSRTAERLLAGFDPARYAKVVTCREPEPF